VTSQKPEYFEKRRSRLIHRLKAQGLDSVLVTNFINVTYLTGFSGDDSYLLISGNDATLLSDGRYELQIAEECPGLDAYIRPTGQSLVQAVARYVQKYRIKRLAVEAASMSLVTKEQLSAAAKNLEIVPTTGLVEGFRMVKDAGEISRIRRAVDYAERAFTILRAGLQNTQTETQLVNELEYHMRRLGAKSAAFPTIVAAGPRAALPHAVPTQSAVGNSPVLLVDWGANEGLYCCDLTRVLVRARIPPKLRTAYEVVLEAQSRAISVIRPGVAVSEVDRAARKVIEDARLGRYFNHGLGHGFGLEIHEGPRLSASNGFKLRPGMVVTVEPGVYFPGVGGVRIEDDVLVTRDGAEVLTRIPKQFDEMLID